MGWTGRVTLNISWNKFAIGYRLKITDEYCLRHIKFWYPSTAEVMVICVWLLLPEDKLDLCSINFALIWKKSQFLKICLFPCHSTIRKSALFRNYKTLFVLLSIFYIVHSVHNWWGLFQERPLTVEHAYTIIDFRLLEEISKIHLVSQPSLRVMRWIW